MDTILNYIKINDKISTSGQPTLEELKIIADNDFKVVINLALSNSSLALENEDKIVSQLGMTYIHIPVDFENPEIDNLKIFLAILNSFTNIKVWVHCAKNYRVTAFMYVFHKYFLKTPFENINLSMFDIWTPSKKWQELMKISLEELQNS
ncbi:protein tyrosine phosphatase family protein [Malaciobacter mytili]|uniref:DSP-PTPase phosphatase fused to NAD+ Kinase domain-containing protein n=1 Tax=Malaciobacter mytili LMG 24559 TaxID=1032238 RepID=A0AAX2AC29_9BACT|nr:protein tyrosine phosphatase family protein [Malaciobacter mytili]AXH14876.1 putative phosphatase (DUF442 domain) [Malaciobacter mytili LMG 24559]RXK12000.1 hypothetical protein CP985_14865 [Malaciobacter mytili LMG 24559]